MISDLHGRDARKTAEARRANTYAAPPSPAGTVAPPVPLPRRAMSLTTFWMLSTLRARSSMASTMRACELRREWREVGSVSGCFDAASKTGWRPRLAQRSRASRWGPATARQSTAREFLPEQIRATKESAPPRPTCPRAAQQASPRAARPSRRGGRHRRPASNSEVSARSARETGGSGRAGTHAVGKDFKHVHLGARGST